MVAEGLLNREHCVNVGVGEQFFGSLFAAPDGLGVDFNLAGEV